MQDAELLMGLAGIAGVFVGFGALISVRSGGISDAHEIAYIRSVVWVALWVVVAALAPVIIGRYGIAGHELWLVCSLVALVLWLGLLLGDARTPESREEVTAASTARIIGEMAASLLLAVPMLGALALVVLGAFPDQEPALYLTAVALGLFMGAFTLLVLVFSQRRQRTAASPAEPGARGGSTA
jgi:uncharacterized membrane protein